MSECSCNEIKSRMKILSKERKAIAERFMAFITPLFPGALFKSMETSKSISKSKRNRFLTKINICREKVRRKLHLSKQI